MSNLLNMSRVCVHQGIEYRVLDVLDNDLLLCVTKEDFDQKKFPLTTVVLPDDRATA